MLYNRTDNVHPLVARLLQGTDNQRRHGQPLAAQTLASSVTAAGSCGGARPLAGNLAANSWQSNNQHCGRPALHLFGLAIHIYSLEA